MSEHFYFQQRWFTTIELTTQYFLPEEGFGTFGRQIAQEIELSYENGEIEEDDLCIMKMV